MSIRDAVTIIVSIIGMAVTYWIGYMHGKYFTHRDTK